MIYSQTQLGMKKGAALPLSLYLKVTCFFLILLLSACATPVKKPTYSASGEILSDGNILRVWRKDSGNGVPEKIQIMINSGSGSHQVLQRLNYSYQKGKLSGLISHQYLKNGSDIDTVLHFDLAGEVIFKQSLINNQTSAPSLQQVNSLITQQKKLLNLSEQLKQNELTLSQGLYTQGKSAINCEESGHNFELNRQTIQQIQQQYNSSHPIGIAWLSNARWLPFYDKNQLLLTNSQNVCLDQPKWFITQSVKPNSLDVVNR